LYVTCVEPYFGLESEGAQNSSHVETVKYVINNKYSIFSLNRKLLNSARNDA
jgi:hypothetical protein